MSVYQKNNNKEIAIKTNGKKELNIIVYLIRIVGTLKLILSIIVSKWLRIAHEFLN